MVLIFAYFCNNNEGFAGTVDAKNAEALATVSSVYNKDNMTLTNLTATGIVQAKALYAGETHLPLAGTRINYITGDTNMRGGNVHMAQDLHVERDIKGGIITGNQLKVTGDTSAAKITGTQLCIGDVCINKDQLQQLRDNTFNNGLNIKGVVNIRKPTGTGNAYIDFLHDDGARWGWLGMAGPAKHTTISA